MFVVGKQYVSDDIAERRFVCHLNVVKVRVALMAIRAHL
jgi:hypothetical protein